MNAFCQVNQALHGPSERGDQPQTFLTRPCTGRILFCPVTLKLPSKQKGHYIMKGLKKNIATKLNTAGVDMNPTPSLE